MRWKRVVGFNALVFVKPDVDQAMGKMGQEYALL